MNLALWKCHKVVGAMLLRSFLPGLDGGLVLIGADAEGKDLKVTVDRAWGQKNRPHAGGYFVRYADGYTSFSPAGAFEAGYTRVENVEAAMLEESAGAVLRRVREAAGLPPDTNTPSLIEWVRAHRPARGEA